MKNVPEQLLESVQQTLRLHEQQLKQIADVVVKEQISNYPIFIFHREPAIQLGKPIILSDEVNGDWNINISLLEEFVKYQLLIEDKLPAFKEAYNAKKQEDYLCCFVISGNDAGNFLFYPYHKESFEKPKPTSPANDDAPSSPFSVN